MTFQTFEHYIEYRKHIETILQLNDITIRLWFELNLSAVMFPT